MALQKLLVVTDQQEAKVDPRTTPFLYVSHLLEGGRHLR